MVTKQKTITRKIHFFHFDILVSQPGSSFFQKHPNPEDVFVKIAGLEFIGEHLKSRFKYYPNSDVCFLNDVSLNNFVVKGRFALSRRSALPALETGGVLQPLNIPANSGLAEITHFIYFPEKSVLGVEFNFHGPRTNSLKNYLLEKSTNFNNRFDHIDVLPILNQDLDLQLQDMGEINLFQMEIARNELSVIEELDRDLYSAFESAARVSDDAESVEIVLRKKKYSRGGFPLPFSKERLKALLSFSDNRQKFNKIRANAESHSEESNKNFDLLEDKMITSKKVASLGLRARSVDSDSMFEKIEEAYEELKENF